MVPYGKRLVKLRGKKSQAEVANAVGIATSTLGMYETEQRMPRDSIKMALAKYYGVTVQYIFLPLNVTKKDIKIKERRRWYEVRKREKIKYAIPIVMSFAGIVLAVISLLL